MSGQWCSVDVTSGAVPLQAGLQPKHVADELAAYSYKRDKRTDEIIPQLEDKANHTIDALRYALAPLIRKTGKPGIRTL